MKIALNASTLTRDGLEKLKQEGLNAESVEAWHNFYPRPETGLDAIEFWNRNRWLKSEGFAVMAFIPGDHRNMTPFAGYIELCDTVDKIVVGDEGLSDDALEQFSSIQKVVFLLRSEAAIDDKALLELIGAIQTNRPDAARDCVRAMESRQYALFGKRQIKPFNTNERPTGSITLDNEKYRRYQGEVQITKRDLPLLKYR
jgi:hypothetical protein